MSKPKKPVIKITFTVDKEIADMIDDFHEKTSIPKVKIVEKAVRRYVGSESKKFAELEKEYGKFDGESFGWNDD